MVTERFAERRFADRHLTEVSQNGSLLERCFLKRHFPENIFKEMLLLSTLNYLGNISFCYIVEN